MLTQSHRRSVTELQVTLHGCYRNGNVPTIRENIKPTIPRIAVLVFNCCMFRFIWTIPPSFFQQYGNAGKEKRVAGLTLSVSMLPKWSVIPKPLQKDICVSPGLSIHMPQHPLPGYSPSPCPNTYKGRFCMAHPDDSILSRAGTSKGFCKRQL